MTFLLLLGCRFHMNDSPLLIRRAAEKTILNGYAEITSNQSAHRIRS